MIAYITGTKQGKPLIINLAGEQEGVLNVKELLPVLVIGVDPLAVLIIEIAQTDRVAQVLVCILRAIHINIFCLKSGVKLIFTHEGKRTLIGIAGGAELGKAILLIDVKDQLLLAESFHNGVNDQLRHILAQIPRADFIEIPLHYAGTEKFFPDEEVIIHKLFLAQFGIFRIEIGGSCMNPVIVVCVLHVQSCNKSGFIVP